MKRIPNTINIDWDAPAADVIDALMERFHTVNPDATWQEADAWASAAFRRHSRAL